MRMLKPGGRAAVVIKNTFLSNGDAAPLRRELLATCDLHTVLDCPQGTFQGAGVKTVVLFFEKGRPTRETWYYQLDPGRSLGKTTALTDEDLAEFLSLQPDREASEKSWTVKAEALDATSFDMSVKNPNRREEATHRAPEEIIAEMLALDEESAEILRGIRELL